MQALCRVFRASRSLTDPAEAGVFGYLQDEFLSLSECPRNNLRRLCVSIQEQFASTCTMRCQATAAYDSVPDSAPHTVLQAVSEVSEEDYKRLDAARKQHEQDLQARRELRAARRKASAEKAAWERARVDAWQQEQATPSAPAIASREDARIGVSLANVPTLVLYAEADASAHHVPYDNFFVRLCNNPFEPHSPEPLLSFVFSTCGGPFLWYGLHLQRSLDESS